MTNKNQRNLLEDNWVVSQLTKERVNHEEARELVVEIPRQVLLDLDHPSHCVREMYREERKHLNPVPAMIKALTAYYRRLSHGGYSNLSFS